MPNTLTDYPEKCIVMVVTPKDDFTRLAEMLEKDEIWVLVMPTIKNALEFAWQEKPEVFLLDADSPSNADDRERLFDYASREKIPLMVMSEARTSAERIRYFRRGADDYLTKPLETEEVLARVRRQLRVGYLIKSLEQRTAELYELNLKLTQSNEKLAAEADVDALTRTWNRRALDREIERVHRLSLRDGKPYSLLMMDLDNFKKFNDTFGHPAGDALLLRICDAIRNNIRKTDFLGRYGGEEFVLIMPETGLGRALEKARELCAVVAALGAPHPGNPHGVATVSIGVGAYDPAAPLAVARIVDAADKGLYAAKKNGRNRAEVAHPLQAVR